MSEEFELPDDYEHLSPAQKIDRIYDEVARVYRDYMTYINPRITNQARKAYPGHLRRVVVGYSKKTAQVFLTLTHADDDEGVDVTVADSTMQVSLREALMKVGVRVPPGKVAVLPAKVTRSRLGPCIVLDARMPDYEPATPRAPRKKKGQDQEQQQQQPKPDQSAGGAAPSQEPKT